MINFDNYTGNKSEYNLKWPYMPDHPYRILIIVGSGSGQTSALFNIINHQPNIDKIYLYVKDLYETKYRFLIKRCEGVGLKHCNDPKAFIQYSNDMNGIYNNIKE